MERVLERAPRKLSMKTRAKMSAAHKAWWAAQWVALSATLPPKEVERRERRRRYYRKWWANLTPEEKATVIEGRVRRAKVAESASARKRWPRQLSKENGPAG